MKRTISILALYLFVAGEAFAQINETPLNRYAWNKKDTEPESGFVVLKSGTRMEGILVLKGNPQNVKKLILTKEGRTVELDPESIQSYGLNVGPLISDSPAEMYEWKPPMIVNGVPITKTKEKKGYVILNDGKRIEGDLHLHKEGDLMDEIIVKNDDGKQVFKTGKVSHYGIVPTIFDLTNEGKKVYDHAGKNFTKGSVTKADGTKTEGVLAFRNSRRIPKSDAIFYQTVYYTPTQEGVVTTIESFDVAEVTQVINGTPVTYLPFEDGFVEATKIGNLSRKEQFKTFLPGRICLKDKTVKDGLVAQSFNGKEEWATSCKFKTGSETPIAYKADQVLWFEQKIKDVTYKSMEFEGVFVELLFDGKVFSYYKNPHPKTVNQKATNRAKNLASLAAGVGSAIAVDAASGGNSEAKGKANQQLASASKEELKATQDQLNKIDTKNMDASQKKDMARAQTAVALNQMDREIRDNLVIYNVEYYALNKKTGENKMLIKSNFDETIEPLLKSCEKYLFLSKSEQKQYLDMDNVDKSLEMLDECYSK